jgi:hypothetical protein
MEMGAIDMPSSSRPYQSKILQFVLRQIQQGIDRHQRAVRQVQVAAVWGLQIAMSPIYAVMRAMRLAGTQLGQGASGGRLPLLGWFRKEPSGDEPAPVVDPVAVDATLEAWLDTLSDQSRSDVAMPIFQTLASVQTWLLPEQRAQLVLSQPGAVAQRADDRAVLGGLSIRGWLQRRAQPDLEGLGITHIQGLATDLTTRALLLVGPNNEVWDILTTEQQIRLHQQIFALVDAFWRYQANRMTLKFHERVMSWLPLPKAWKRHLFQPRLWGQAPRRYSPMLLGRAQAGALLGGDAPELGSNLSPKTPSRTILYLPRRWFKGLALPEVSTFRQGQPENGLAVSAGSSGLWRVWRRPSGLVAQMGERWHATPGDLKLGHVQTLSLQQGEHSSFQTGHGLETEVVSVEYIEHPLEKLLRWIDQVLSWFERQWARLMNFLRFSYK